MIFYLIGIAAGIILPVQTCVNTKMARKSGSALYSTLISFAEGTALLIAILLISQHSLNLGFKELSQEPFWVWLGGSCGVIYVACVIMLNSRLGVVQSIVLPVLGQILMSLLLDNFGWFGSQLKPVNGFHIAGALLVFLGVLAISMNNVKKDEKGSFSFKTLLFQIAGILSGMISAVQTAINGYAGIVLASVTKATALSFGTGLILLIVICLVYFLATRKNEKFAAEEKGTWWMWFGGVIGLIYIYGSILVTVKTGTGMAVLLTLSGTTAGGVLIDQFGWLESPKKPLTLRKIIGLVVMFAGVAINSFLG